MKISIRGTEITLKRSYRTLMVYERLTGKSFQPEGITEVIYYIYSLIVVSSSAEEDIITFDSFMDWLDEHPSELPRLAAWIAKSFEAENALLDGHEEGDAEDKKKADGSQNE